MQMSTPKALDQGPVGPYQGRAYDTCGCMRTIRGSRRDPLINSGACAPSYVKGGAPSLNKPSRWCFQHIFKGAVWRQTAPTNGSEARLREFATANSLQAGSLLG